MRGFRPSFFSLPSHTYLGNEDHSKDSAHAGKYNAGQKHVEHTGSLSEAKNKAYASWKQDYCDVDADADKLAVVDSSNGYLESNHKL